MARILSIVFAATLIAGCGSHNQIPTEVTPAEEEIEVKAEAPQTAETTEAVEAEAPENAEAPQTAETTEVVEAEEPMPAGAATANFKTDKIPFYAYVAHVDRIRGRTTIGFEKPDMPTIVVPESYGAELAPLRFEGFDRDLLLVNAKLEDEQFNKYYLYIYKNKAWQEVVNSFTIHRSNISDTLQPITVNPENPSEMLRYYSIFDLSGTPEGKKFYWRLVEESVPIKTK